MQGTMLWFNREKGYGFIRTEDDGRLPVRSDGFLPGQIPESRCKGRAVTFEEQVEEGDARAVNVSFVIAADSPRARLRTARAGSRI